MLLVGMMQWWYTCGWKMYLSGLKNQLRNAVDFFSISLLVRNLFAPFRQISAGETTSPAIEAKIAAFFDQLFSRIMGMVVRLCLLIIGTVTIVIQAVAGIVIAILWPLAPALVVGCVVCSVVGVTF